MTADIVERLRKWSVFGYGYEASCDMKEAATDIEIQRANMAGAARLLSEQTSEIERQRTTVLDLLGQVGQLSDELERTKREAERAQDAYGVRLLSYLEESARTADRIEQLEAALREADEALTQFVAFEDDCRFIMGNTNYSVLLASYKKVRAALGDKS